MVTWRKTMSNTPSCSVGRMATCLPTSALEAFHRLFLEADVGRGIDAAHGGVDAILEEASILGLNWRGLGR